MAFDCSRAIAQEALGEAIEVDRGRRARKEAIDRNLYNLKAGPVLMRFDALMGFELNDNPQLVEEPEEVDFAFHPELRVASVWPLNQRNALSLNLGIGYRKYLHNTDLDQLIIAPNSEIAFDIRAGDVTINFHERVGYTQNPVSDPTVSGTGDFGGIENTVGLRADWDLNQVVLTAGYDHVNFFSSGSAASDVQERSQEMFYTRGTIRLGPSVRTGVELGAGLTDYELDVFADNTELSAGPFVEVDITKELLVRASGGYIRYDFDEPGFDPTVTNVVPRVPETVDDFYANVTLNHQLSRFMSHNLSMGREARAGAESELVTLWYVRYGNDWNISQHATLITSLLYENGRERAGIAAERFWRVGAGAGVSIPLTRQLKTGIAYQLL
ncbi:MAG TPA: hypothetical protein VK530_18635, partial [Candidatus Acidoferrum sp.]|nr:hypothetical protein [Candidatus Acidoferrum sp.]